MITTKIDKLTIPKEFHDRKIAEQVKREEDKAITKITYDTLEEKLKRYLDDYIMRGYRDNFVSAKNISETLNNLLYARVLKED